MSLIDCADCGSRVSPRAASCPQCGAGIAGARVHVELTSKRLKIHQALATLVTLVGFAWLFVGCNEAMKQDSEGPLIAPLVVLAIGLAWTTVTRVRVWWHHR
jgi:hypothetical protein